MILKLKQKINCKLVQFKRYNNIKEEINIVHKRNSGVSLICIYKPDKNFLINFIVR